MSQTNDLKWKGYAIHDTKKYTDFQVVDFEPKRAEDYDIDIAIEYCGVCGSDVHTITGGWSEDIIKPMITGHEIAGKAVRVGPKVTSIKVGDNVGVGAQIFSCLECKPCKTDNENYCPEQVDTYNAKYPNGDIAHGGYSTAIRAHERFVFPIPDGIPLDAAAPLFCAGATVFSPLKRHGAGPGKSVGIVGIGGLGHLAVQFAKALGSEKVVAFSHQANKKEDAMKLGADEFVLTTEEKFAEPHAMSLDLIISTVDVSEGLSLKNLMSCLGVHGRFIQVGIPDKPLPALKTLDLAGNGGLLGSTHIGSKKEILEMLQLVKDKGVKTWVEVLPMKEAGKAVERVKNNQVRYRHVLKVDI